MTQSDQRCRTSIKSISLVNQVPSLIGDDSNASPRGQSSPPTMADPILFDLATLKVLASNAVPDWSTVTPSLPTEDVPGHACFQLCLEYIAAHAGSRKTSHRRRKPLSQKLTADGWEYFGNHLIWPSGGNQAIVELFNDTSRLPSRFAQRATAHPLFPSQNSSASGFSAPLHHAKNSHRVAKCVEDSPGMEAFQPCYSLSLAILRATADRTFSDSQPNANQF